MSVAETVNYSELEQPDANYQVTVLDPNKNLSEVLAATTPLLLVDDPEDSMSVEICQNVKQAKKSLKKKTTTAIIIVSLDEASSEEALGFVKMVRNAMKNRAVRIVSCASNNIDMLEKTLISEYQIDAYRDTSSLTHNSLSGLLASELKTFKQFKFNAARRDAEVNLLTTLAQFSRAELNLHDCLREFNNTICIVSGAKLGNVLLVNEDGSIERSELIYNDLACDSGQVESFIGKHKTLFNDTINQAVAEQAMQMCLSDGDREHKAIQDISGCSIGGSLVFPLKSYNKTLALVQCFLQKEQMDYVSVELVQLVEKSSEQLSVLLERRESEDNLQKQYERLKQTLSDLKNTKTQLYQSEKMASVGQLAAGIAHEINNPLTFVMGNFSPLDEYVDSMTELLKLHGSFMQALDHEDTTNIESLKHSISSLSEQADMGFVLEDIRSLVSDSRYGLKRVKEIIANLKEFSHVDQVETQKADLHKHIDTTLKMLSHQIKDNVEIVKEYGDIPQVGCNPGLLNQVFMNLLQNSIHAVEDKQGIITIKTLQDGDKVGIKIRDNGSGIPEDKLPDIFNPFFTTKPVGKGTGLGLSVSHGIIEKHNGEITVDTKAGEFTEFTIMLPLN